MLQEMEDPLRSSGLNNDRERTKIIDLLVLHPDISHAVFGRFKISTSHIVHEPRGESGLIRNIFRTEFAYEKAFAGNTSGEEFKARTVRGESQANIFFVLTFNDRQGDYRPGSHTDYLVIIPKYEAKLIQALSADPGILVEVFQAVYPDYDRSMGKLQLDSDKNIFSASL